MIVNLDHLGHNEADLQHCCSVCASVFGTRLPLIKGLSARRTETMLVAKKLKWAPPSEHESHGNLVF